MSSELIVICMQPAYRRLSGITEEEAQLSLLSEVGSELCKWVEMSSRNMILIRFICSLPAAQMYGP